MGLFSSVAKRVGKLAKGRTLKKVEGQIGARGAGRVANRTKAAERLAGAKARKAKRAAIKGVHVLGAGLEAGLAAAGQGDFGFEQRAQRGQGSYEGSSGGGSGGGGGASDVVLPPMDQPKTVSKIKNPSLSSIQGQLGDLIRISGNIAAITKEQQEQLLAQTKANETSQRESQLEQSHAEKISGDGASPNIEPIDDAAKSLLEKLSELTDTISNMNANQIGQMAGEGLVDWFKSRRNQKAKLNKGFQKTVSKDGKVVYRNAKGQAVKAEEAIKNINRVKPSEIGQASALKRLGLETAEATAKPGIISKATSSIAGTLGKIAGRGKAAGAVGKAAIKKLVAPIVAKSVGKLAIKSIPLVGAAAGGIFAIGKLLKGDLVGAGLEAASGLGSVATALPAMVLSIARDGYMAVHGSSPEEDAAKYGPGIVADRLNQIKSVTEESIKESLGQKVEKKEAGAPKQAATKPPAIPSSPTPQTGVTKTTEKPQATPAPSVPATPEPSKPPAAPAAPPGGATSEPAPSSGGAPASAQKEQAVPEKLPPAPAPAGGAVKPETPETGTGSAINSATEAAQPGTPNTGEGPNAQAPLPATLPTTKPKATGMGNVPEPSYMMGSLTKQMYFGAAAEAMAA